ncbi:MAG TPA: M3 family oligoendopeptidase [Acidimicrobiia bacterium]|jgi:oligoendopeptidase F|nr:M3 family oligoendopeptidase [Acidimicrobiia bacterium]
MTATDLTAEDVAWDLETLLPAAGDAGVDALLAEADEVTTRAAKFRGRIADCSTDEIVDLVALLASLQDLVGRAGNYASLRFSTDTADPARGALMMRVEERATAMSTQLVFFELEWAALDDAAVDAHLADPRLEYARHHLRSVRRYRPHLLSEPEEVVLTEKTVTGTSAWVRLFEELDSAITVELDGESQPLEAGLSRLGSPDPDVRRTAAEAVTAGLAPGLRTRAYVFNTLLADKAIDDRMRKFPSWIAGRNLANEASDESVAALVTAVQGRYSIPQRWYRLKARLLGVDRVRDYDRMASIASSEAQFGFGDARELVLDSYASFSPDLADIARKFFDEQWIDAPVRPGKRGGAFCAYTVPSHHPYVLLNWTARRRDVLTLAHELGHGLHAYLARPQGVFHQSTPLTLAETASVFGETVTFGRLLSATTDPAERLALLAENLEGQIATVFRQVAMNRFEDAVHNARRDSGELAVDDFNEHWIATQSAMLGDSVELTEGYRTWWSYIPHFIATPGYVYAYAYGQLLALAVYAQYEERGSEFVPRYLELLTAGGSMAPEDLGTIVGVDLSDPAFWDGGLDIVERQLALTEAAAAETGRL